MSIINLIPANNLSDLANAGTARTNLGLGSAAVLDVGTTANKVVQLTSAAKLPAVDGSLLTNLPAGGVALGDSPTWTGKHIFAPTARTSGSASWWAAQTPADTTLAASTESIGMQFGGNSSSPPTTVTRQWNTGALATQRENVFVAPTYSTPGASIWTNVGTVVITGAPNAAGSLTITNPYALWVQGGGSRFDGVVTIPNGSASAPGLCMANASNTGLYATLAGYLNISASGAYTTIFGPAFQQWGSGGTVAWTSSTPDGTADVGLIRVAAKVLKVAAGFSGNGWLQNPAGCARLAADATNATATLATIGLTTDGTNPISLIAGRKYVGRMSVKCINSTATEGLQFDFNGGSATMTSFWAAAGILASGGTDVIGTNISTSLAGVINFTTFTGESVVVFEISLVCNAAGTFIPRFAENSSAVGTATIRLGSFLWLEDSPN